MPIRDLKAQIARLPEQPGVYLYSNGQGETLYVGKARVLRDRVRSYLGAYGTSPRIDALLDEAERHRAQPDAASRIPPGFSWSILYYTACGYALLTASSDDTLRREQDAARAVEMLQQIVQAANPSALLELLKTDRELDPLRQRGHDR